MDEDAALLLVRRAVGALAGVTETTGAGGRPCVHVGGRTFAYLMADHSGDGRLAVWVTSTSDAQAEAVAAEPERFVPPYAGPQGWLGLRLDVDPDEAEVAAVLAEGWRLQAPRRLQPERAAGG